MLLAAAVGAVALTGRYARTRLAYEVLDVDGRRYGETEEVESPTPLYTVALRLRPGRYRVKVAAKDADGRIGSVEHPFEVTPPPAEGLHVGGALLFRDGRGPAHRTCSSTCRQGSTPSACTCSCTRRRRRGRWTASAPYVDVTHLDEQVSRFNGPMAVSCGETKTACELDATVPVARWPEGRYRADITILRGGEAVARRAPFARARSGRGRTGHDHDDDGQPRNAPSTARPAPRARTAYVDRYATRAVSTVAEEHYVQAIFDNPPSIAPTR